MKQRTYLRNDRGGIIGYEERDEDGTTTLYNASGRILGTHRDRDDLVRNDSGRWLGTGRSLLGALLGRKSK